VENRKKLKSYNGYAQKYRLTVRGVRGVSPEEEIKGMLRWEGFAANEGLEPGMKERGVMEYYYC